MKINQTNTFWEKNRIMTSTLIIKNYMKIKEESKEQRRTRIKKIQDLQEKKMIENLYEKIRLKRIELWHPTEFKNLN